MLEDKKMSQSQILLSSLMIIMMAPAFAVDVNSNQNNSSNGYTTAAFNISRPSEFNSIQIEQHQTDQQYKAESRDRTRDQIHQIREESLVNVGHTLEENHDSAHSGNFLADDRLGRKGNAQPDDRSLANAGCRVGQIGESADDYELNGCRAMHESNDYAKYVYYKQSVTVVSPNSPLYQGDARNSVESVTTGQQVANRNANQNVLFFCTAGNQAQTAEAFKQVKSADLSVWTDLESFAKCKAWANQK